MNKKNTLLLFLCLFSLWAVAQEKKPVKIACVGNSITYGSGVSEQLSGIAFPAFGRGVRCAQLRNQRPRDAE